MNWENFQQAIYDRTENTFELYRKRIIKNYQDSYKEINNLVQGMYAKYLNGVRPEDYYNQMIVYDRLTNLKKQIYDSYTKYNNNTYKNIEKILRISFSNNYYYKMYTAQWIASNARIGVIPDDLTELCTLGTETSYKTISKRIQNIYGDKNNYISRAGTLSYIVASNKTQELNKIQSAITTGLITGRPYRQTASIIKSLIGGVKTSEGIKEYSGFMSNAMRIVRTESNRVMNSAAYASSKYLDNQGINVKRQILSVLDNRTRAQSASMDGQTRNIDEPFTYPNGVRALIPGTTGIPAYDINDRETVIEIINDEGPKTRRGRNPVTGENEEFSYKSFDEWAKENNLKKNIYGEVVSK